MDTLSHHSQPLDKESNIVISEYKADVLSTQLQNSVASFYTWTLLIYVCQKLFSKDTFEC
jgi:hypothetical protein